MGAYFALKIFGMNTIANVLVQLWPGESSQTLIGDASFGVSFVLAVALILFPLGPKKRRKKDGGCCTERKDLEVRD